MTTTTELLVDNVLKKNVFPLQDGVTSQLNSNDSHRSSTKKRKFEEMEEIDENGLLGNKPKRQRLELLPAESGPSATTDSNETTLCSSSAPKPIPKTKQKSSVCMLCWKTLEPGVDLKTHVETVHNRTTKINWRSEHVVATGEQTIATPPTSHVLPFFNPKTTNEKKNVMHEKYLRRKLLELHLRKGKKSAAECCEKEPDKRKETPLPSTNNEPAVAVPEETKPTNNKKNTLSAEEEKKTDNPPRVPSKRPGLLRSCFNEGNFETFQEILTDAGMPGTVSECHSTIRMLFQQLWEMKQKMDEFYDAVELLQVKNAIARKECEFWKLGSSLTADAWNKKRSEDPLMRRIGEYEAKLVDLRRKNKLVCAAEKALGEGMKQADETKEQVLAGSMARVGEQLSRRTSQESSRLAKSIQTYHKKVLEVVKMRQFQQKQQQARFQQNPGPPLGLPVSNAALLNARGMAMNAMMNPAMRLGQQNNLTSLHSGGMKGGVLRGVGAQGMVGIPNPGVLSAAMNTVNEMDELDRLKRTLIQPVKQGIDYLNGKMNNERKEGSTTKRKGVGRPPKNKRPYNKKDKKDKKRVSQAKEVSNKNDGDFLVNRMKRNLTGQEKESLYKSEMFEKIIKFVSSLSPNEFDPGHAKDLQHIQKNVAQRKYRSPFGIFEDLNILWKKITLARGAHSQQGRLAEKRKDDTVQAFYDAVNHPYEYDMHLLAEWCLQNKDFQALIPVVLKKKINGEKLFKMACHEEGKGRLQELFMMKNAKGEPVTTISDELIMKLFDKIKVAISTKIKPCIL